MMTSVLAIAAALLAAEAGDQAPPTPPSSGRAATATVAQPDPAVVKQVEGLLRGQGYSEDAIRLIVSRQMTRERAEVVRIEQLRQVRQELETAAAAERPNASQIGILLNRMTEVAISDARDKTNADAEILKTLGPHDLKLYLRGLGLGQPVYRPGDRPLIAPPAPPAPPPAPAGTPPG